MPVKITVPNLPTSPIVSAPSPLTSPLILRVKLVAEEIVPPKLPSITLTVAAGPVELATEFVNVPLFKVMFAVV